MGGQTKIGGNSRDDDAAFAAMLAAPRVNGSAAAHAHEPVIERYVVKQGDSLARIALAVYGDARRWKRLYDANKDRIADLDTIQPGQVLDIPL